MANGVVPELAAHALALLPSSSIGDVVRSAAGLGLYFLFLGWPLFVAPFAATWALLATAGRPGWISMVPVYNWIALLRLAGLPAWWLVLLVVPGLNVVFWAICCARFSRAFGQGPAFAFGLCLLPPIYMTLLAWKAPAWRDPRPPDRARPLPAARLDLRVAH